jgi:hypothetical protein
MLCSACVVDVLSCILLVRHFPFLEGYLSVEHLPIMVVPYFLFFVVIEFGVANGGLPGGLEEALLAELGKDEVWL